MKVSRYLNLILFLPLLVGCGNDEPPPPDVSDVDIDLTVLRFDRDLSSLDTTDLPDAMDRLDSIYGSFTDAYFTYVVPVRRGDFSPEEGRRVLKAYLDYPLTAFVDSLARNNVGGGAQVQGMAEALRQALRYYRHYLPEAPVPDTLVTYTSHFELAAFLYGEGQLAAGLDFFLGPEFDYSAVDPEEPIFSHYLNQSYTPEHFAGKMLRVIIEDRFPPPRRGQLIDYLIYEGKKLYLLELLLPETPDHVVYEITEEQMQWLRDNESPIYAHLQREDDLFTSEVTKINKYTRPAPYSPGMPRESPGGSVNYLGRQIVASFLSNNPEVSLAKLMEMDDAREILRRARYKPR